MLSIPTIVVLRHIYIHTDWFVNSWYKKKILKLENKKKIKLEYLSMIFFVLFWVQESSPSHLYHELRTILYINGNFRLLPVHFVPSYFRLNAHDPHCAPLHRDNRILSRGQRLYRALLPNLCKWISATSRSIERLPKYKK